MGSQEPSERIAPRYLSSDGMDAAKLLQVGGIVPDPWQADVLADWMGRDAAGRWAAPSAGGSVPRQNGKSLLVQGRAISGMLLFTESVSMDQGGLGILSGCLCGGAAAGLLCAAPKRKRRGR